MRLGTKELTGTNVFITVEKKDRSPLTTGEAETLVTGLARIGSFTNLQGTGVQESGFIIAKMVGYTPDCEERTSAFLESHGAEITDLRP